jgi:SNF2 family DNA or RNA helicase
MTEPLILGTLVRWLDNRARPYGVVAGHEQNGKRVAVRFDDGETRQFVWPSEVLERVVLEAGSHVELRDGGEIGVIGEVLPLNGAFFYGVTLPGGGKKTVKEDGIRPAVLVDPIDRLRAGQFDSARSTNLRTAATRLLYAHQFDELSSLSNSRVEVKPHQVGVVHRVATHYPHRFILADEVGLGKTIEAGLIIKELKARGVADRVLILAPSGIVSQWQFELKTKFNQRFSHYTNASIRYLGSEHPGDNVWTLSDNVVVSTTFAAWDPGRRRDIAIAGWDLVVIDEAHHARRTWQSGSHYTETNLYRLAEMLADPDLGRAQSFLLLTATPMQLHRFELYSLIELLDPTLFPTYEDFAEHADSLRGLNRAVDGLRRWPLLGSADRSALETEVMAWIGTPARLEERDLRETMIRELEQKHRLSDVLIRNRKKVVGGFQPRIASQWQVELTEPEREAYTAVTTYVQDGYARARATQNNALGFVMTTFQKLNASSSYALRQSLLRRIEKLESSSAPTTDVDSIEEADLSELEPEDALSDVLAVRLYEDRVWEEVRELEEVVAKLDAIELDSKARVLRNQLALLLENDADAKVIIFTQFRATQDYLVSRIGEPWHVELFHGSLSPGEKDAAVERFRDGSGPQILLTTEAGGEGRNFQFCHLMVNYDLPWNPMKVEQRIGRIDRIGQKHPVKIFNFSTIGTIEERVVEVLTRRIGVFEETIGGLDPILGSVEQDLRKVLLLADEEAARQLAQLEARIEAQVHQARRAEEKLGDFIMDTRSFRKDEVERLLSDRGAQTNDELKRFVLGVLNELGVKIEKDSLHPGVYDLRFSGRFADQFPQFVREGMTRRVTFDPAVALDYETIDFLAFGHEIVDALVDHVRTREYPGRTSHRIVLSDERPPRCGWFFVYTLELGGMMRSKELVPIFIGLDGEVDQDVGAWLLDVVMRGKDEDRRPLAHELPERDGNFDAALQTARQTALLHLMERQASLEQTNRERLADARFKLERFYEYRERAAREKLASVRLVHERVSTSEEPSDQRIAPVWAKNLENAERVVAGIDGERRARVDELLGRETVTAQDELLVASFVDIQPNPAELLTAADPRIPRALAARFLFTCRSRTADDLRARELDLVKRREQLVALASRHTIDVETGTQVADALTAAVRAVDTLDHTGRAMLGGAIDYFLLVADEDHDLKSEHGFDYDRDVADAVLSVIGLDELRVLPAAPPM